MTKIKFDGNAAGAGRDRLRPVLRETFKITLLAYNTIYASILGLRLPDLPLFPDGPLLLFFG